MLCKSLQSRDRKLEAADTSDWMQHWQSEWKSAFGDRERVPFVQFRGWIQRKRLIPGGEIDEHVWSSLQRQVGSYTTGWEGTVSVVQICRVADGAGGDLVAALHVFIASRAQGSRIDHPRQSDPFRLLYVAILWNTR